LTAAIIEQYVRALGDKPQFIDVKVDDVSLVDYDALLNTELAVINE
jgi:hypothetical protein